MTSTIVTRLSQLAIVLTVLSLKTCNAPMITPKNVTVRISLAKTSAIMTSVTVCINKIKLNLKQRRISFRTLTKNIKVGRQCNSQPTTKN